nr:hypothetical protein [uncultured Massilia sp.]
MFSFLFRGVVKKRQVHTITRARLLVKLIDQIFVIDFNYQAFVDSGYDRIMTSQPVIPAQAGIHTELAKDTQHGFPPTRE